MKRNLLATIGLLAGLALCAIPQAQAQNKVQLGVVTALTGPLAAAGVFQMNGFKLAVDELNAAGGITVAGRKYTVELKVYDTRATPSDGASAMQRLATVDKVPVVLGELSSGVAAAIAPIAQDYSMPLILTVPTRLCSE
jgi:branched-chain amino acid transport system substrate-binding protein